MRVCSIYRLATGKCNISAKGHLLGKSGVQTSRGDHHPKAIQPNQAHPTRRLSISFSSSCPLLPYSRNPAETIIAPFTPVDAHSATSFGTVAAGVAMIAKSTTAGASEIFGNAFTPRTLVRFRLIG